MKNIINIFLAILLVGCSAPGINFYQPVKVAGKDGTTFVRSVKVASFVVDIVGAKSFSFNTVTGDCRIEFSPEFLVASQYAVINKKGDLVGILNKTEVPGIYTARNIDAYSKLFKDSINSIFSGVTGAILSIAGPVALGGGLSAIPVK